MNGKYEHHKYRPQPIESRAVTEPECIHWIAICCHSITLLHRYIIVRSRSLVNRLQGLYANRYSTMGSGEYLQIKRCAAFIILFESVGESMWEVRYFLGYRAVASNRAKSISARLWSG